DQVCWLAVNTSKTAVAELMRVAWRTVGAILERVAAEAVRDVDLLDGLRRIGIELSSITTAVGWCGPLPVMTAGRCSRSLTNWAKNAANRSN
ncbi:MAG TPA: transposase family protein, partial [Solirubrobacteraceae bacterium]|nr:transposase family protein [Solirubrobacteraceae bacterium]